MQIKELDINELNKTFRINADGELERYYIRSKKWKVPPIHTNRRGYRVVAWKDTHYQYHRIIWAVWHQQDIPHNLYIDHIDGDVTNNAITNLRVVTPRQNDINRKIHRAGHIPGVYKKSLNRYGARIQIDGCTCYLGYYSTKEKASEVYNLACTHTNKFVSQKQFTEYIKKLAQYKPRTARGYWRLAEGKYIVELYLNKQKVYVGTYYDENEAAQLGNMGLRHKDKFENPKQYRELLLSLYTDKGLDTN